MISRRKPSSSVRRIVCEDDLDAEIVKKTAQGYSLVNTIFEDTRTAVLFQGKREVLRADLREAQQLCDLLNQFYAYTEPDIADFEQAIGEFKQRVAELAPGLSEPSTPFLYASDSPSSSERRARIRAVMMLTPSMAASGASVSA